ncbi:amidohydrolase [Betaproteobacteria bacterium]|nr:amidohydrolase [Betaproteobacteria bacterium]
MSVSEELILKMRQWRHHLHIYPETAFNEVKTSAFIADLLISFGIEVHTGLAGTGVVGVIHGKEVGPWIGLRADIDALDVQEINDFEYRSQHPGKMHACGHDGHTAMLLGAASYLAATRDFSGTVALIFQPAEENEGGGRVMVEQGLFDQFPIESVFGLHNWPGVPVGTFAISPGAQMASYDVFEIIIEGKGAHAAMPHLGKDSIVAAGQLIGALQTIVNREADPLDPMVVSVTQIHAGDTWNVLPQQVMLRGTTRAFDPALQDLAERRIGEIVEGIAKTFGVRATVRYERRYPPTINDPAIANICAAAATALVGPEKVDLAPRPAMGAEDFAFLMQVKPGAYVWLGVGPGKSGCMLHNPGFDFNDEVLSVGADYWVEIVRQVLGKKA